jgi:glucosamine-6-phosphate deaminase
MISAECAPKQALVGRLQVNVYPNSAEMGSCAAIQLIDAINTSIEARGMCTLIMATGNSQLPLYAALRRHPEIEWQKVVVLHMDEYLGLSEDHPASFRRYMREQLVNHVPLRSFFGVEGDAADTTAELQRYTTLLRQYPTDVCILGIGENGHLAFNDPPADFTTAELINVVTLDQASRQQQVGEGHFATLADVPSQALSLTVPALLSARQVMALVPEKRKAAIVRQTLLGPISPACPASVLRNQSHAVLYLDADSAREIADILG